MKKSVTEFGTNYSYLFLTQNNPTFESIRKLSVDFVLQMPESVKNSLHQQLENGVQLLDSEALMSMYTYAYGKMHHAKLNLVFEQLKNLGLADIHIIDWGCGQGLATVAYADFLKQQNINHQSVKTITLIEPSTICLKRAALHTSKLFPETKIRVVNKFIDEITNIDIELSNGKTTIHLFSNILDIDDFDLQKLTSTIQANDSLNYLVCVSPYINDYKSNRLRDFVYGFYNPKIVFEYKTKNWHCGWSIDCYVSSTGDKPSKDIDFPELDYHHNYNKSNNHEDSVSQFNFGMNFLLGKGVKQDFKEAVHWFQKSAEKGYAYAQLLLGQSYEYGKGVNQNYSEAVFWYTKSAKQENSMALYNLGHCFYSGKGIIQDSEKAVYLFQKSAKMGYSLAQLSLGHCYKNGKGVEKDYDKAIFWYTKSAKQGEKTAQYNLGLSLYSGIGVKQDYEKAIFWLNKSAEQDEIKALYLLGLCYHKGDGVEQDFKKAFLWFSKVANEGDTRAHEKLGDYYFNGKGVEKDYFNAMKWYSKGLKSICNSCPNCSAYNTAEKQCPKCQFGIGQLYLDGLGVKQDYDEAIKYFINASEQGYDLAKEKLKELNVESSNSIDENIPF